MRVTVLGTGDVVGTPKVGCSCPVCTEARETGKQRLRTSILVEHAGKHLLIDTGPDMRAQLLAAGSPIIDAVIWTHGHYDHFMGFGDFYRVQREPITVYGAPEVLDYCGGIFSFMRHNEVPMTAYEAVDICGMQVTLFPVMHDAPTYGVRIEADGAVFVYSCDTTADLSEQTLDVMKGADLLLLDGIFPPEVHISKHMNIKDAEQLAAQLNPKEFWCVHMSHKIWWSYEHGARDMQSWVLGT
ncbi:MBL fold metallo-hydrolase [Methanorbis furvi]|uniref:Phosphoribosyl 1,2-cyclic phosphate phosphodiesterase n=1 Tax=Methanorbis furvi TaxID=3028299 RepID=A0AAE4MD04_9EURY|nr:Phosphoribosyl 1,2-cyclic phosphate phosphodiesterase [Methanocorpusculaceae archaeon Ag1]